jgi:hypothetical protein
MVGTRTYLAQKNVESGNIRKHIYALKIGLSLSLGLSVFLKLILELFFHVLSPSSHLTLHVQDNTMILGAGYVLNEDRLEI